MRKNKFSSKVSDDTTLVIATYNRPVFLELALKGVLRQKILPYEVIIADDGSTDETRELIERYAAHFPVPLVHSWIPDEGFRLAKSRNVAIAKVKTDYIIVIDGDIVISPSFVKDHILARRPNMFLNGGRARLTEWATKKRCRTLNPKFSCFTPGLLRPLTMLRIPWLHSVMKGELELHKIRGCNMSFWRSDIIRVNGYEERIIGWGCDDTELAQRFFNVGMQRKNIKGLAICVHLYHKEAEGASVTRKVNGLIEDETREKMRMQAGIGIDQYLN